jgi:radical SAM superfamily enzyme YgiQ (UPF0313 family)
MTNNTKLNKSNNTHLKLQKPVNLSNYKEDYINTPKKSLRVLLIFPPETNAVRALYTFEENPDTSIGIKPPLGVLYLASYLKRYSPHQVKVLDCQILGLNEVQIEQEIRSFKPDVVGVSAWTDFWFDAYRCIQIVKKVDKAIHVTIGGPHVGVYPQETLDYSGCDSIIIGDGEIPLFWLINSLSNNQLPAHLPGLHTGKGGVKKGTLKYFILEDLDLLPYPDRTLLPYRKYYSAVGKSKYVTTMITSRGCPYRCIFCKLNFQKTLSRSVKNILDEIEEILKLGIGEIEIYDDTFTWSKKRVIEICQGIIDRDYKFNWAIRDRVSNKDEEIISWLARAGCKRIHFGIESGNDKTLKVIKKGITKQQAINAVNLAKKFKIEVLTYFMFGLPGETIEDMRESIRFAKDLSPDYSTFSVTVPYAGTEMYETALSNGIIPYDYWLNFAKNPKPKFEVPFFWEEHLSKDELRNIRDEATRSFYFRPTYIFKQVVKTRNFRTVFRKAKMAWGLLKAVLIKKQE